MPAPTLTRQQGTGLRHGGAMIDGQRDEGVRQQYAPGRTRIS